MKKHVKFLIDSNTLEEEFDQEDKNEEENKIVVDVSVEQIRKNKFIEEND